MGHENAEGMAHVGVRLADQLGCGAEWKVGAHTATWPRLEEQRCCIGTPFDVFREFARRPSLVEDH